VVTNSVENAVTLSHIANAKVLLTGGELSQVSMSLSGAKTLDSISGYHMDKAFISCNGLDIDRGVTEGNDEVAGVKQAAINASDRIYLVVDSEKFGRASFAQVCSLDRVDVLITDKKPDARWLEVLEQKNIRTVYPG
ncbi:MAG: DeoR/GlpR transcriptional regulator, partial [Lachnospiraceae bacterium]|nr:DeoR/GlpR transcriptional regulator [Lachnospiraceae bacterium]